jgi:hypothetical protein
MLLAQLDGNAAVTQAGSDTRIEVGSGEYRFEYPVR